MKKIKQIDYWVSIILIAAFTIISSFTKNATYVLIGYFVVGGWQVISMIVHAVNHWFISGRRLYYHWIVGISLLVFPLTCWVLIFIAPLMAIYYTGICYREVNTKMRRPLAYLK